MPIPPPSASPVVVSRIQNRRGTQSQFLALYPPGYLGAGGFGDPSFPGFDITNYPSVLMPGELALCTDSRRIYMGNLNGEYIELAEQLVDGLFLGPSTWVLPPVGVFTPITKSITLPNLSVVTITMDYVPTPFFDIIYSITDDPNPDWNTVGVNYARNGSLQITAVQPFAPLPPTPPFPTPTPANLTDSGTEINNLQPSNISFIAQYNLANTDIEILYMHDFPVNLTLNTSTIQWLPF